MPLFNFYSWTSLFNTSSQLVIMRWTNYQDIGRVFIGGTDRECTLARETILTAANLPVEETKRGARENANEIEGFKATIENLQQELRRDKSSPSTDVAAVRNQNQTRHSEGKPKPVHVLDFFEQPVPLYVLFGTVALGTLFAMVLADIEAVCKGEARLIEFAELNGLKKLLPAVYFN